MSKNPKIPKNSFHLPKKQLTERLEALAVTTQLMICHEYLEINGEPIQRCVVATSLNYLNAKLQFPVFHLALKSGWITLRPGSLNRSYYVGKRQLISYASQLIELFEK